MSRSPIYAHFSETLSGVETIRAYRLAEQFALDRCGMWGGLRRVRGSSWGLRRALAAACLLSCPALSCPLLT